MFGVEDFDPFDKGEVAAVFEVQENEDGDESVEDEVRRISRTENGRE